MRVADWVIALLGVWTAITGGWGVVEFLLAGGQFGEADDVFWIGTALLAAGIGLVLVGTSRMRGPGAI